MMTSAEPLSQNEQRAPDMANLRSLIQCYNGLMWRRPAIVEEDLVDDAVREDEFANMVAELWEKEHLPLDSEDA
ncbi:MAG TPA: hypothetical protein VGP83_05275 [Pyrinomonadaceae bacterium]|nr:hypothetical protein [Pyrinomonadaceae bacterium]